MSDSRHRMLRNDIVNTSTMRITKIPWKKGDKRAEMASASWDVRRKIARYPRPIKHLNGCFVALKNTLLETINAAITPRLLIRQCLG